MRDIIFNLKNIVVVILASEFLKQLVLGDKYKKYISLAVSLSVIGFIIATISGTAFDISIQPDFNYSPPEGNENMIITEYKKKIMEKITKEIPEISEIEVEIDDDYNVTGLSVKTKDYEKTDKKLKELGFTGYEIMD